MVLRSAIRAMFARYNAENHFHDYTFFEPCDQTNSSDDLHFAEYYADWYCHSFIDENITRREMLNILSEFAKNNSWIDQYSLHCERSNFHSRSLFVRIRITTYPFLDETLANCQVDLNHFSDVSIDIDVDCAEYTVILTPVQHRVTDNKDFETFVIVHHARVLHLLDKGYIKIQRTFKPFYRSMSCKLPVKPVASSSE